MPLKLREQNPCACPTHTDPKDEFPTLYRSFSTWLTVHELPEEENVKMAPRSSENTGKLSVMEEIHWNPQQHLLLSATGGCSVEASLRCGAQTNWNKSNIQSNCSGSPPVKFSNSPRLMIHTLTVKNIFLNAIMPFPVMVLLFIKKTIDNHCWCRAGGVINPPYQTQLRKLLVTHNSFSFQIIFKHSAHCMEADT